MTRKSAVGTPAKKKDQQRKNVAIIASILSIGGGIAAWNLFIVPTQASMAETRAKITTLDGQIQQAISIRDQLPQLRADNERLQGQLAAFRQSFPREESLPALVVTIGDLAQEHHVDLGGIGRTATIKDGTNIKQVALSTTASGSFPDLYAFMKDLGRQQRYLSLDKPSLSISPDGMSASLTVNAYVLMPNSVRQNQFAQSDTLSTIPTQPGAASTAPAGIQEQKRATNEAMEGTRQ